MSQAVVTFDQFTLFISLTVVVSASPGPVMLNCLAIAVREGAKATIPAMIGASLGNLLLMFLSALGCSWLVTQFPDFFKWIQWGGGAYLIWLGGQALRSSANKTPLAVSTTSKNHFRDAFTIAVSNPKGLLYFGALIPQFIHYDLPLTVQFTLLTALFLVIDLVWMWLYAIAGERIMALLSREQHRLWFNRFTALVLIVVGLLVSFTSLT